jgi:hypothetical protein
MRGYADEILVHRNWENQDALLGMIRRLNYTYFGRQQLPL